MLKSLNGLAPPVYLQDLFSERHTDYDMRDSLRKLNLPEPRTDYSKRSFGYSGALLWNSLPENIRTIRSIRPGSDAVLHMSRIEFEFRPTQINLHRLNLFRRRS